MLKISTKIDYFGGSLGVWASREPKMLKISSDTGHSEPISVLVSADCRKYSKRVLKLIILNYFCHPYRQHAVIRGVTLLLKLVEHTNPLPESHTFEKPGTLSIKVTNLHTTVQRRAPYIRKDTKRQPSV